MPHVPLKNVQSWAYWLQHPDLKRLESSPYDLLVVDYAHDGHSGTEFTREQIRSLRAAGKVVLAYISIGEAEEYRFYWQPDWKITAPDFLGPENPDWAENHKVRYWQESWWEQALRPYLDRILAAGFSGLYLDIVDAYYFWGEAEDNLEQRANDMVALIARIAAYSKGHSSTPFYICIQNGFGILDDASPPMQKKLLQVIDLAASEDLFFHYYSEADKLYRKRLMQRLAKAGKKLLTVEYIPQKQYQEYLRQVNELPFAVLPYVSTEDRGLDSLLPPLRQTP